MKYTPEEIPAEMFGAGTIVAIKDAKLPEGEYVPISGTADFTPPDQSWNTTEVSYLDQTTGIKRRIKASKSGGDATFTVNPRENDAGVVILEAAYNDRENDYAFKVTRTDGTTLEFYGAVTQFAQQQMTPDGTNSHAVTVQVNSEIEITPAGK